MDDIKEIEEVKQRYEKYKSNVSAYPDFYRAWQDIGTLLSKIKELEEVEEERHRFSKLLIEARIRIVELEENNEGLRDALNLRKGALVQATNGIKQLNKCIKELGEGIEKYLNDPEFDTNILSELIKKEKP